jgi:hypothetical protein
MLLPALLLILDVQALDADKLTWQQAQRLSGRAAGQEEEARQKQAETSVMSDVRDAGQPSGEGAGARTPLPAR